jgi:DNA-binding IclR family transcriptional regulator
MRLIDIAAKLDVNQPTVLRHLTQLINSNYVYQEKDTLRYGLTMKICKLGDQVNSNLGIRTIVSPYLNSLSNTLNVSSCLVIERNFEAIYLDLAEKPGAKLNTFQHIGKNAPLNATGSGKLLLSTFSERKLDEFIEVKGLEKLTPNTLSTKEELIKEFDMIRRCGYAIDNEECELGIRCVTVPIYDFTDSIVAALSVFDLPENLPQTRIEKEIIPVINKAQRAISQRMGSNIQPIYTILNE